MARDAVPYEKVPSLDDAVRAISGNAIREQFAQMLRQIGEHFLTLSRGHSIPRQEPETVEEPARKQATTKRKTKKERGRGGKKVLRSGAYHLYKQVFDNICSFCQFPITSSGNGLKSTRFSTETSEFLKLKQFSEFFEEHGVSATRAEFKLRCAGCRGGRAEQFWPGPTKARIIIDRELGATCARCTNDIANPAKNKILIGPGETARHKRVNFVRLFLSDRKEEAKAQYSVICRSCFNITERDAGLTKSA